MAQKKGLIYRLTMGKDNLPDFTPDKLPGTRFQVFKDVFFGRIGAMVKINLLVLLFALPLIVVIFFGYMTKSIDSGLITQNQGGLPFPVVEDASEIMQYRNFVLNMQMYVFMIPAIVILFIGLSGAFYVMRRFVWAEGVGVASHFFHGIKANWLPFFISSLFLAISFVMVMFNISAYNFLEMNAIFKVIGLSVTIIAFVLLICMAIFLTTQAVTYKLKMIPLIKNSFLFAIALLPLNIIMLILSVVPFILLYLLMGVQMLNMIVIMILLLVGFSYVILLWTVYAHWAYDRFINDRVEGAVKNRGMYVMTEEEKRARKEKSLLSKNIRFNNPAYINKEISSIDEGATFTPLSPTFSRADLEKLAEEKAIVKKEIDAEFGETAPEPAPAPQKKAEIKKAPEKHKPELSELQPKNTKSKASFSRTIKKK